MQKFEEKVYLLETQRIKLLEEFELNKRIDSKILTSVVFSNNPLSDASEEKRESFNHFGNNKQSEKGDQFSQKIFENYKEYDLRIIEIYAKNGSLTAIRSRSAFNYFRKSTVALISSIQSKNDINKRNHFSAIFVENFANSIRETNIAKLFALKDDSIELVTKILRSEENSKSQLDIDARVCYAYFHMNVKQEAIDFLNQCEEKYPNELFFNRWSYQRLQKWNKEIQ
jgi:hypothetical protein